MSKQEFYGLVAYMTETYGVRSYLDNQNDDEDPWFECPECGEPILWSDYGDDLDLMQCICPICKRAFDGTEYYGDGLD